ncbi:leucine-rich repeat transmembrane protein FLRT1-like [Phaenicophaeus curvirostris]|uniref:leucine-rich repeat transmembrane protein FLRT1-like n=1 Tax=Phaenicophaeus curvirostris TaxID=33595 RepID=UPI0037F0DBA0
MYRLFVRPRTRYPTPPRSIQPPNKDAPPLPFGPRLPPMAPPPFPPPPSASSGGAPHVVASSSSSSLVLVLLVGAAVGAACPAVCRCAGSRVYCNDRGLTAVPEGLPLGATTLFLQNNRIGDAGIPARLARLPALRVLYLYANALERLPEHLPPALRELHLQDNNVRGLCRRALARAPLLERLHLDDNSVSAAAIEEDAFADNRRLRLLFLSRNHLSSVPPGLPPALEELRLDDNRIHTIPLRAFRDLPALRRLVLDGNLLANQRMADDTFSRLQNLSELSLGRNALAAPPANLPRARLRRLSLAANAISHVPAGALARMRALERLDLSDNNLTTLPRGLFDDLGRLSHLGLRNNPWFCGCNLAWLRDWLRRRAPTGLEVKGLLCQAPARLRGLPVGELRGEMDACDAPAAGAASTSIVAASPGAMAASPASPGLWVQAAPGGALRVRWPPWPAGASLRLSWLRPGRGALTETLVRGERGEYVVRALTPRAPYRVCLSPLDPRGGGGGGGAAEPPRPPLCAQARAGDGLDAPSPPPPPRTAPLAVPPAMAAGAAVGAALLLGGLGGCWRRRRRRRRGGMMGGAPKARGGGLALRALRPPDDGGVRTVFPPLPPPPPLPHGARGTRGGRVPHGPQASPLFRAEAPPPLGAANGSVRTFQKGSAGRQWAREGAGLEPRGGGGGGAAAPANGSAEGAGPKGAGTNGIARGAGLGGLAANGSGGWAGLRRRRPMGAAGARPAF